jgi:hypothetical protein
MKKVKFKFPIAIIFFISLTIIGYNAYKHFYQLHTIEESEKSAYKILSQQAIKVDNIFRTNEKLFLNVANEIEILPSTITDIIIYKGKILHITNEGTNYSGEQPISDISKQLENAVEDLISNDIDATISIDHDQNGISFTMFNDSDGACFYEIDIVYSKNGKVPNDNIIKLDDNWYLVKCINWGT